KARSKIVATVGPACQSVETLVELIQRGVDVFRVNAAHGTRADFELWLDKIRQAREITGRIVAVLLDLAGPKIRLGQLVDDPLDVEPGMELALVRGDVATAPRVLCSNYPRLIDEIQVKDQI